jgi:hypothetical protein
MPKTLAVLSCTLSLLALCLAPVAANAQVILLPGTDPQSSVVLLNFKGMNMTVAGSNASQADEFCKSAGYSGGQRRFLVNGQLLEWIMCVQKK